MKKTFKKILASLLVAIMVLSAAPIGALTEIDLSSLFSVEASALTSGNYTYTVSGTNATITAYSGTASTLSIPSTIGGYTVTAIGKSAFEYCSSLETVTLPATLIKIESYAFNSSGITTIKIPEGVTTIEEHAFSNCSYLKKVIIPSTITSMGTAIFENCINLSSVSIAEGTKYVTLGSGAFRNCTSLQTITIPGNYITIGRGAFYGCSGLKSATWKNSGSAIANQKLEQSAFEYCSSLESVSLPTTLSTIGNYAFNSSGITTIKIPEGVTAIEEHAFSNCSYLKKVIIPSTITSMGTDVFENCINLSSVSISKGHKDITLGGGAFRNCTSLQTITIPGNYITIGKGAFYGCSGLKSITWESTGYSYANQKLESSVFGYCSSLETVSLPTTLNSIGDHAFHDCSALTDITIPAGVTSVNEAAFVNCSELETVIFLEGSYDLKLGTEIFKNCKKLTTVHFPLNLIDVGNKSFENTSSSLTICSKSYNSYGKTYADNNSIKFKLCNGTHTSTPTTTYTVTFNANKGSVSPSSASVTAGSSTTLPTPTKFATLTYDANGGTNAPAQGKYYFDCLGWSTSSTATSASYSCGSSYKPSGNVTLYAVWAEKISVNLSTSKPVRDGYTFLGWSNDKDATEGDFQPGTRGYLKGNVTLYAVWEKNPTTTYKVTYNANKGSVSPSSVSVPAGSSTILPTPTRYVTITYDANGGTNPPSSTKAYFNCLGWSTSSTATSASYACGSSYMPSGNVTLYAVWESKTYTNLTTETPTRSGYKFLGWALTADATEAQFNPNHRVQLNADRTIYAVWEKVDPTPAVEYKTIHLNYKDTYTINTDGFSAAAYLTEDDSVVSVDTDGKVRANGTGSAEIHVYDSDSNLRIIYTFDVEYSWWQWILIIVLFGWIWY